MNETSVILAVLGLFGTIIGGFFKLFNDQNKVHAKIATGLDKVAKSSNRNASAAEKAAREAESRNGHLAELILEQGKQTEAIADKAVSAIIESTQHVSEQKVEHQTVKEKD